MEKVEDIKITEKLWNMSKMCANMESWGGWKTSKTWQNGKYGVFP